MELKKKTCVCKCKIEKGTLLGVLHKTPLADNDKSKGTARVDALFKAFATQLFGFLNQMVESIDVSNSSKVLKHLYSGRIPEDPRHASVQALALALFPDNEHWVAPSLLWYRVAGAPSPIGFLSLFMFWIRHRSIFNRHLAQFTRLCPTLVDDILQQLDAYMEMPFVPSRLENIA